MSLVSGIGAVERGKVRAWNALFWAALGDFHSIGDLGPGPCSGARAWKEEPTSACPRSSEQFKD